ncbi:hypothetical protein [Escherichia coli]|uniref:hypothetical protein n=1 Tax=Escherichia coli TaxID=562 RepID=UPI0040685E6D
MIDAIRRHHDYTSLHPWSDKDSLEIILNIINRNAIKHRMSCEGSLSDMLTGLKEINEVITKEQFNVSNVQNRYLTSKIKAW